MFPTQVHTHDDTGICMVGLEFAGLAGLLKTGPTGTRIWWEPWGSNMCVYEL